MIKQRNIDVFLVCLYKYYMYTMLGN